MTLSALHNARRACVYVHSIHASPALNRSVKLGQIQDGDMGNEGRNITRYAVRHI